MADNPLVMWQKYKKNLGNTRPWDLIDGTSPRVSDEEAAKRLAICNDCPYLIKLTQQCKKCGCFMSLKVKLAEAACPVGNWDVSQDVESQTP